jgi:RNA polymerase sigma-54 factor
VVSPAAACERIREMVEAEDPARPLADEEIARALAVLGIPIARRTVVKYRDHLGIAASPVRRILPPDQIGSVPTGRRSSASSR